MTCRLKEVARFTRRPRAVAEFYAGVLGQPLTDAGQDVYKFDVAGINLIVHPADGRPPAPGWPDDVDHIAFEVEDLDAECERLAAAGYAVKGPTLFPWGRSAYLYDPDGRMVELIGRDVAHGADE